MYLRLNVINSAGVRAPAPSSIFCEKSHLAELLECYSYYSSYSLKKI